MRAGLPFDRDRLGGVLGPVERIGHHERDGVADVANLIPGEQRIGWRSDGGIRQRRLARQRTELGNILGSENKPHTRLRAGGVRVRDAEARMRVRRAHHDRVQHVGGRVVGDVTPRTAQQRVVLLAQDWLAETEFNGLHGGSPPLWDRT